MYRAPALPLGDARGGRDRTWRTGLADGLASTVPPVRRVESWPSSATGSPYEAAAAAAVRGGERWTSKTASCVIAHLSDLHTGSQYFVPNLLDRALVEVNDLAPDMVVVTGDLTNMGYRQEFREAREYLDRLDLPRRAGGAGQPRQPQRGLRALRAAVRHPGDRDPQERA